MLSSSLFLALPLIFTLVAASISHFLTAAIKFSCYSSNEIGLLCFFFLLFLFLALSLLSTPMRTLKLSRKKESASLLLFFISKSPGSCAIYCRNARVLEMQNFTPAYMKGWTYVLTYFVRMIFSEAKFLGCIVYQIFLPMVLCCALESAAITFSRGYFLSTVPSLRYPTRLN